MRYSNGMTSHFPTYAPPGLLDGLLELVWLTRCVACEKPGSLLCEDCASNLPYIDPATACPRCGAPFGSVICTECYSRTGPVPLSFSAAVCALSYNETVARLIRGYKDLGERRLAPLLAQVLAATAPKSWLTWADAFTYIPAGCSALRKRGFDHMEAIALQVASLIGLPVLSLLEKPEATDQRVLGRVQRYQNLTGAFRVQLAMQGACFPEKIIMLDDVLTTGATLDAASSALLAAGAREVRVATIARVW